MNLRTYITYSISQNMAFSAIVTACVCTILLISPTSATFFLDVGGFAFALLSILSLQSRKLFEVRRRLLIKTLSRRLISTASISVSIIFALMLFFGALGAFDYSYKEPAGVTGFHIGLVVAWLFVLIGLSVLSAKVVDYFFGFARRNV